MRIQENPFYILNLPCSAGRRDVMSAAEELSFLIDSEVCSFAQNELINLGKRLAAELGWFIELDKEQLQCIRDKIENRLEIQTDGLTPLSRLNATLYNFSISSESDVYELGYAILDIDEQYTNLDANQICQCLNQSRANAKLSSLTEKDVSIEINNKRDDIRQIISEKMSVIDQDSYIELITMLAEKCIANDDYEDGIVLADVIDQYEVRIQSQIEESTDKIETHIANIQQLTTDEDITENINILIRQVKNWDKLAQPLQLKSQASGMPHEISEQLGRSLRNLAIYLHNEKGKTNDALTLVDAMKDVFAELRNLYDIFDSDSDALNDLLQGEQDIKEVLAEMDEVQKNAESLKSFATNLAVYSFIRSIEKLNFKLKSLALDSETRIKMRMNLCYMAREVAVELHNKKHQTEYALDISKALSTEFGDMPSLKLKLLEDIETLNQQLSLSDSPSYSGGNSSNQGCSILIGVIFFIMIVISIISSIDSSPSKPSTNTSNPASSYSQDANSNRNTTTSNRSELDELKNEIDEMERKLKSLGSYIDDYESQLENLNYDIDYYESQYYLTGNDFYYNSYYSAIDEYNDIYEDYSDAIDEYNSLYSKYTNAIDSYNQKIGY